jgi:hypothetical protein
MNLEGTKHEKAVLIIIAYIIGFTSSFIAFGVMKQYQEAPALLETTQVWPEGYTPPTEQPPLEEVSAADMPASPSEMATYEDGKLYATVEGERYVLSLSNDIMDVTNVEGFATQGIHEALPTYSASADGRFVHFCEQQTPADSCTHFVFDASRNVIQPLSLEGKSFITTVNEALSTVWNGDALRIAQYASVSQAEPWKMVPAE